MARGDGRLFLRRTTYWIAYCAPGTDGRSHEVRESSKSDSEATAQKLLKTRLREVANHRGGIRTFVGPTGERITVGELLDSLEADYREREIKSLRTTLIHAKPVREFFGHRRAMTVNADLVREYVAERQKDKLVLLVARAGMISWKNGHSLSLPRMRWPGLARGLKGLS